jgi:hypothetical protein
MTVSLLPSDHGQSLPKKRPRGQSGTCGQCLGSDRAVVGHRGHCPAQGHYRCDPVGSQWAVSSSKLIRKAAQAAPAGVTEHDYDPLDPLPGPSVAEHSGPHLAARETRQYSTWLSDRGTETYLGNHNATYQTQKNSETRDFLATFRTFALDLASLTAFPETLSVFQQGRKLLSRRHRWAV